jgi:Protein of unknown function (DUF1376)
VISGLTWWFNIESFSMNFSKKSEKNSENPSQGATLLPLISAEIDVSGLPSFMLNTQKLLASELMANTTGEVLNGALRLWCMAWQQKPPASLPDNNKVLADFAHMSANVFKKLKNQVMRGFVLCSDGRWYHPVLVEEARRAYAHRLRVQKEVERVKKWRHRNDDDQDDTRNDTRIKQADDTRNDTRNATKGDTRNERGDKTRQDKEERDTPDRPVGGPSEKRATRWPADAVVPEDWFDAAATRRSAEGMLPVNLTLQAELFTNYWASKSGKDATKIDWKRTWINWVLNAKGDGNGRGRAGSKSETELAGARAAAQYFIDQGRSDQGSGDGGDAVPPHPALPSH